ncbi:MAG: hypothetical protein ABF672_07705, partial [Gluconobacter oxydans]
MRRRLGTHGFGSVSGLWDETEDEGPVLLTNAQINNNQRFYSDTGCLGLIKHASINNTINITLSGAV